MFIRFSRDFDAGSGAFYENGKVYDMDRTTAQSFINAGAAALVTTTPPAAFNPAAVAITGGTINGTPIGATTRSTVATSTLAYSATDSTGTPGNVTNNAGNGRAAFAAASNTVTVTNSLVAVGDTVQITLLGAADATLLYVVGVTVAAGSFTVTGNAAATATKGFMFTIIKT